MECLFAELSYQMSYKSHLTLSHWKNHGTIKNPPSCDFKLRLHRNTYFCKIMQNYAKNFHAPLRMVLAPRTDGIHGEMIQMTPWTTWIMSNQEKFRAQMYIRDQCRIPPKFLLEFLFLKYYQQSSYKMVVAPFLRDFKFCTAVSGILFPNLDILQESSLWRLYRVTNVRMPFLFTHTLKFRVDKLASQQEATNHKLYYEFVKYMIHRHVQLEKYQDVLYEYTMFLLGRTAWRHVVVTNTKLMMFLLERYIKRNNHPRLKKNVNVFLKNAKISRCYMTKKNSRASWLQWEGKWTGSPTEQLLINKLDNPQDFFCLFLKHGLVEEAGILLRNHKDICSVPHYMYCAKYGSVGMLQEMEKRGLANALCRVWSSRYNAFFYAVCGLNVGVVKYLVHEKNVPIPSHMCWKPPRRNHC